MLTALERLVKIPIGLYGINVVNTPAPSFFIRSSSFLQGNEDMHKSLDKFEFRPDSSETMDLVGVFVILVIFPFGLVGWIWVLIAIERLENQCIMLRIL